MFIIIVLLLGRNKRFSSFLAWFLLFSISYGMWLLAWEFLLF